MNFLPEFKKYLFSQKTPASKITVKNYASDIAHFIKWFEEGFGTFSPELVTPQFIEQFKQTNTGAISSLERNISSLRKFFNFLVLEGVIPESPLKQPAGKKTDQPDPWKLKAFKNYLYIYNASPITIKNYLMDVKAFLRWIEAVAASKSAWDIKEKDILGKIDNNLLEEYKGRLPYKPRTINRKLSSLRKYLKWAKEEGLLPQIQSSELGIKNYGTKIKTQAEQTALIHHYSGFPPLRALQKIIRGAALLPDLILINPLASIVLKIDLLNWMLRGKPVFTKVKNQNLKIKSIPKEIFAPLAISTSSLSFHRKLLFHLTHTRPNWYKRYHSYSIAHYLHLAILIVFTSAVGFGVYQSFVQKPNQAVLGTNLTSQPNPRLLSFQGKLTDASGNPITTQTSLRFGIYDSLTATGSALKWQEVDTLTPDSDGIFSVLLGQNSSLTQDLFANHVGLWLGVTVGKTAELTPRQQLATVAYAENSETLQGLPPITQTGAATTNVVLALDSSGNLTIGGSATPTFQATGGQFTLSGNGLALTTTAGTNTDIIATPSGLGKIDLNKPIRNTSNNNNVSSAKGAVEVDDMLAVLATSSGQSALTINQNSSGPLISASTSGTAKFTVDNSANTTIAGGNFSQTGSGTFSTGTGTVTLNGSTTIASGNNFTLTSGNTSLTSSAATSNALSLTDTSLTSGTGFAKTFTSNAGNGQTTIGESIALTDSTTAGGGYTGLSISTSGSGNGTGNKYLLDLKPAGDSTKELVFDSSGSLHPTVSSSTNTVTLGSSTYYLKNVYTDQLTANTVAGTVSGGSTSSTSWTIGSTQTGDVNEALIFQRNSGSGNASLQWNAGSSDLRYLTANYPLNATYTVNNSSIGTTIDLLSANLTNNTTSGTQNLLSLTNTGTGTTANGIYINNTGTGTTAIQIAGTWTTGLLTNNLPINAGSGAITGGALTGSSLTDSGLSTAGVVLNSSAGLLSTLAGTTTTVLHGNASGAPTFASVSGSDLASNITISTTGNISTTGTGTITSAGLLTASNGLTLTTGALSLTSTSGNVDLSGSTGTFKTSTGANTLSGDVTISAGKNLTVTSGAVSITPTNASTVPVTITGATSQSADLLDIKNSLAAVIAKVDSLGNITGNTLTSTVAQGTSPLTVTSTTVVANLNAAAAQEPNPNLVLNSDFGRRNSWMTFMPETFADTSGWTQWTGTHGVGTVASNILTANGTDTDWAINAGISTWKDARFSAQFKIVDTTKFYSVAKWTDSNNYVDSIWNNGTFYLRKVIGGTGTYVANVAQTGTLNNWYWLELEAQGTTYIAKIYSCGASACTKSSSTLLQTLSGTISDSGVSAGKISIESTAPSSQWGGLSTGDGGVYVEGWGPESIQRTWEGTLGGQAIGFDESTDSGAIGKQWALRTYIPAASRGIEILMPNNTGGSSDIPIAPSTSYTSSLYEKVSGLGGSGALLWGYVREIASDGSAVAYSATINDASETSYTRKSASFTSNASTRAGFVVLGINWDRNAGAVKSATGTLFIDLVQVEQGAIATPWRNAPADDDPIVWDTSKADTPNMNANQDFTSSSATEFSNHYTNGNFFFPWDAGIRVNSLATSCLNTGTAVNPGYVYSTLDGSSVGGQATGFYIQGGTGQTLDFTATDKVTAGKHRIAMVGANDGTNTMRCIGTNSNYQRLIIIATRGKYDLAEEYTVQDQSINAGDVVRLARNAINNPINNNPISSSTIEKTTGGYEKDVLGIVSTAPGITLSSQVELNSYQDKPNLRPVALSGRVPVKVTNENGDIHRGDTLTSSATMPGYAMKATRAGRSIGIAMEDFAPALQESTTNNPIIQFGKIMTFVNLSWYDPDVYLTSTGNFVINKVQTTTQVATATPNPETGLYTSPSPTTSSSLSASTSTTLSASATSSAEPISEPIANCQTTTDSSNFGLITSSCPQTESTNYIYQITDSLGNVVQRVGVFSQAVVGSLRTGLVQTKDLIADNITVNNSIVSPLADIQKIQTDVITPLSSNKVVIKLQPATASATLGASNSATPSLEIQNASGSAVATINAKGDASFSGRLTTSTASISGNLSANSATISGTLKAKNIIADNIDTQILNLKSQLSNLFPAKTPSSSGSAVDIASYSAQLAEVDTLQANVGTFTQGLFAIGPASLSNATVFGQLSIGSPAGGLILADSSINVLGGDLKLQPLGQGGILLGKAVYIDANGDLSVSGNAKFKGTLFTNVISPIPGGDLTFKLLNKNASDSAQFKILNASGSAIATINNNGEATFRKLNLNFISPAFALSSTEVIATGSAGIATVSAQQKELTIDNKLVTDKSLIYITPIGTPSGQIPFLLRQAPGESFTVGLEHLINSDMPFNWLIIN